MGGSGRLSFYGRISRSLPHDEFLYLGGNEQSTHEYISKLLGKETIDTNTFGKSIGRNGNYSTNYQISGRELLTPDEVRMMDNQYALLFIRGERPVQDLKFDILKHPNVALTTDGKTEPYIHGFDDYSVCDLFLKDFEELEENKNSESIDDIEFVVYSSEEIEEFFKRLEGGKIS